ncbi:MAG: DUF2130 domain-containing protein [Phytoplasma sp.]|uniref:DUF2130 domain-containing protein n=1 Tax=Phytoplasma sp. TaxID=2155 RepID=UPI002B408914|nr:DUF2130 domain-containing protein [Phytoplasma sp.]WRH06568.1 MAG: DUF2130 domain-containing protein [Phytoplasma sp.]
MKKIKSLIKNSYELELQEDGHKGDIIDLKECLELNLTLLQQKLHQDEIQQEITKTKEQYEQKIKDLHNQQELLLIKTIMELENKKNNTINELKHEITKLTLTRTGYNVKLIGEHLEKWCNNEVQNQLLIADDISWYKDNQIIQNSKGDFVYKLHYDENKKENELLTSALLEVKSEAKTLDNVRKQKNEQFFKKLDKDRNNKNLEFAILVSELEYDKENDAPVRKVYEYPNMFIIRPPYLVIFLNIITALGRKHKELILTLSEKKQEFCQEKEIEEKFNKMKEQILNNAFTKIKNNLLKISEENEKIKQISRSLNNSCYRIQEKIQIIIAEHLETVFNQIKNFKITHIIKKIKKINHLNKQKRS